MDKQDAEVLEIFKNRNRAWEEARKQGYMDVVDVTEIHKEDDPVSIRHKVLEMYTYLLLLVVSGVAVWQIIARTLHGTGGQGMWILVLAVAFVQLILKADDINRGGWK